MTKHVRQSLIALALLSVAGIGAWRYLLHRRSVPVTPLQSAVASTPNGPALRQYTLPYAPNDIYPSPLGDGNIWFASHSMVQALDPTTGKIQALNDRFGDFAYVMGKVVASDPFEPDKVWVGSSNRGLLCYRKSQGRSELAAKVDQVGSVMALMPDVACLWIGSMGGIYRRSPVDGKGEPVPVGLYRLSRSDGKLELVHGAQQGVEEIRRDKKLGLCFRVGTSWWAIQDGKAPRPIPPFPDPAERLKATLSQFHQDPTMRPDQVLQVAEDGDAIWFRNYRGLGRMDRKTGSLGYIKLLAERPSVFLVAQDHIWVCCGERLFAVTKQPPADMLQSEADIKTAEEASQALYRQTEAATDVIAMLKGMTRIFANIDAQYANASAKQKEKPWGKIETIDHWLREHPKEKLEALQAIQPQEQVISPALRLYTLMCGHALKGDAGSALQAYRQLKKIRAVTPEDGQALHTAAAHFKRIATTDMAPDQRLWETALAHEELASTSWNQMEVGFDQSRSRDYLHKLLKLHPASTFADNAWWGLEGLEHRWSGFDGGFVDARGLAPTANAYLDFLKRYPTSEKGPLARFLMACMVHYANEPTDLNYFPVDQRRAWLLKARTWCQEAAEAEKQGQEVRSPSVDLTPKTLLPLLEEDLKRYPPGKERKEKSS